MTPPRDTAAGFDRIAAEIEPALIRLGRAAPGAELETVRDEITTLLDGAGLRWSDLAARVAAPSPIAEPAPSYKPPPEHPLAAKTPKRLDPSAVLSNEQLARYGYRSAPGDGYGYDGAPIPGAE